MPFKFPFPVRSPYPAPVLILPAVFMLSALSIPPLLRLARELVEPEPSYARLAVAAVIAAMMARSAGSTCGQPSPPRPRLPPLLLPLWPVTGSVLAVRLAAEACGVPALGGLVVVPLVWLAAAALDLAHRPQPLAPAWLAAAALFVLPVKEALQGLAGEPLASLAAVGACALMKTSGVEIACAGPVLGYHGVVVEVVVACSGAGALAVQVLLVALLAAGTRPDPREAATRLALAVVSAIAANAVRIALLLLVAVHGPVDPFRAPWHGIIGALTLALGSLPTLLLAGRPSAPPVLLITGFQRPYGLWQGVSGDSVP